MARGFSLSSIVIAICLAVLWPGEPEAPIDTRPKPQLMVAQSAPAEIRLKKRGNGHFFVHGMVNGQIVEFLVDTGASGIALTVADAERIGLPVSPARWRVIGTGASGPVRGQVERLGSVEIGGRIVTNLNAMVADGLGISLLGQDFLNQLESVTMSGDNMVLR